MSRTNIESNRRLLALPFPVKNRGQEKLTFLSSAFSYTPAKAIAIEYRSASGSFGCILLPSHTGDG